MTPYPYMQGWLYSAARHFHNRHLHNLAAVRLQVHKQQVDVVQVHSRACHTISR
jgi:hypothetical protein